MLRTLAKAEWGTFDDARVVKDHPEEAIADLRRKPGENMVIYASVTMVRNSTELSLIDGYQLLVHPIVMGSGKPVFAGLAHLAQLRLLRTAVFRNRVVVPYYESARQ